MIPYMGNEGPDQTAQMHSLIGAFIAQTYYKGHFLAALNTIETVAFCVTIEEANIYMYN